MKRFDPKYLVAKEYCPDYTPRHPYQKKLIQLLSSDLERCRGRTMMYYDTGAGKGSVCNSALGKSYTARALADAFTGVKLTQEVRLESLRSLFNAPDSSVIIVDLPADQQFGKLAVKLLTTPPKHIFVIVFSRQCPLDRHQFKATKQLVLVDLLERELRDGRQHLKHLDWDYFQLCQRRMHFQRLGIVKEDPETSGTMRDLARELFGEPDQF